MPGQVAGEAGSKAHPCTSMLADEIPGYYRTLLSRLHWPATTSSRGDQGSKVDHAALRCVGITSSRRGEGVSTVAWQLAATAAEIDEGAVLLVDANLADPSLHTTFQLPLGPGLAESLLDPRRLEASIRSFEGSNLSLLTAGQAADGAWRAIGSTVIDEIVETLRRHFELVVFDMPPADDTCAALRLAGLTDGILIVIESQRADREDVRRSTEILRFSGAQPLGAVLNKR